MTKAEAIKTFGKIPSFLNIAELSKLTYIAGIDNFDPTECEGIEGLSDKEKAMFLTEPFVKIKQTKQNASVIIVNSFPTAYTGFSNDDLKEVVFETAQDVTKNESKSAIKRAIVGGVLLGPLGALVGAASGIGEKQKTLMHGKSLVYFNTGKETMLILGADNKMKERTVSFLKKTYGSKFRVV
jgi:hypothetical protein